MRPLAVLLVALVFAAAGCAPATDLPDAASASVPTGDWLGQEPPGTEPELFAPGIVNTGLWTRDLTVTPDGDEIFFGATLGRGEIVTIVRVQRVDGRWQPPEIAPFALDPRYRHLEAHVAPRGEQLLFVSNRPREPGATGPADEDIWRVVRTADGWSEPERLPSPVNGPGREFFPSLTRDGTLYFTRTPAGERTSYLYRARRTDGRYEEPERLPPHVNATADQFNGFVAPDESYLLFATGRREDSLGGSDYYVTFRDGDDRWSEPVNLGPPVSSPRSGEWSASVSPDGRHLFFMASPPADPPDPLTWDALQTLHRRPGHGGANIYWVDAGLIEQRRAEARWPH